VGGRRGSFLCGGGLVVGFWVEGGGSFAIVVVFGAEEKRCAWVGEL
jgi:hypothetical protein